MIHMLDTDARGVLQDSSMAKKKKQRAPRPRPSQAVIDALVADLDSYVTSYHMLNVKRLGEKHGVSTGTARNYFERLRPELYAVYRAYWAERAGR